jgi:hypothetical protein
VDTLSANGTGLSNNHLAAAAAAAAQLHDEADQLSETSVNQ